MHALIKSVTQYLSKEKEKKSETAAPSRKERITTGVRQTLFKFRTLRIISQLVSFLLLNALIFGLGPWPVLLPVVGLLGVPSKTVGDALGAIQYTLFELALPWLALASIFLAAVIVGRSFCAWVCPFGFVQDILGVMKKRHRTISPRTHDQAVNAKYGVLAATLLISVVLALAVIAGIGSGYKRALGVFAVAPFNALSPADTLFAVVPRTVLDVRESIFVLIEQPTADIAGAIISALTSTQALFWARVVILALTFVLAVNIPRGWCRYFCPQGAFSALLMRFSFLGLKRDPIHCVKDAKSCRDCVDVCPMLVPILNEPSDKFTHPECIMCLKCVDACSTKAIRPKFP